MALRAGASGFLLKNAPPEDPIEAIRVVAADRLTEGKAEVPRLVARGLSNAEIAERRFVGEATVKIRLSNLLAKLGPRNRV